MIPEQKYTRLEFVKLDYLYFLKFLIVLLS